MTLAASIEGTAIAGAGGVELGNVVNVLYHPADPVAIGLMVRGPALYGVVQRGDTFLPLSAVAISGETVSTDLAKLPGARAAAGKLGYDPDTTVIWTHMPVITPSGREVGTVTDVEFDPADGRVLRLEVAGGAVADAAHGRYVVPASAVTGYRDGAVRITAEEGALETSGGLARAAAATAVAVGDAARGAGAAAEKAVVGASHATGVAIRAVREAQIPERAAEAAGRTAKRARSTWRDTMKAFREGMSGDDEK